MIKSMTGFGRAEVSGDSMVVIAPMHVIAA